MQLAVGAPLVGAVLAGVQYFDTHLWQAVVLSYIGAPFVGAYIIVMAPLLLQLLPRAGGLGERIGVLLAPFNLCSVVLAYVAAIVIDATGNYRLIWLFPAATGLAHAMVNCWLKYPARRSIEPRHGQAPVGVERRPGRVHGRDRASWPGCWPHLCSGWSPRRTPTARWSSTWPGTSSAIPTRTPEPRKATGSRIDARDRPGGPRRAGAPRSVGGPRGSAGRRRCDRRPPGGRRARRMAGAESVTGSPDRGETDRRVASEAPEGPTAGASRRRCPVRHRRTGRRHPARRPPRRAAPAPAPGPAGTEPTGSDRPSAASRRPVGGAVRSVRRCGFEGRPGRHHAGQRPDRSRLEAAEPPGAHDERHHRPHRDRPGAVGDRRAVETQPAGRARTRRRPGPAARRTRPRHRPVGYAPPVADRPVRTRPGGSTTGPHRIGALGHGALNGRSSTGPAR